MREITVQTVYQWLDEIAPFDNAEAFDNVGLLLGNLTTPVHKVLFSLDATEAVAEDAIRQKTELIVSHHPLMFGGIRCIDYATPEGRTICALAGARINLIVAHTNFDKAPGGTGDALAGALDLHDIVTADEYIRVGSLPMPMTSDELICWAGKRLGGQVRCYGKTADTIVRVAVGPGAYGEGADAAFFAGAQAYVVGEIKHHELLSACARGLVILEAGHFATEIAGLRALFTRFQFAAENALWRVAPILYPHMPYAGALHTF